MTVSSTGVYGVFRLDGGPIDPADAAILGLDSNGVSQPALARGVDDLAPGAVQRSDRDGRITILVGYLDEAEDMAARLGLSRETLPADIARAALARFGAETPAVLTGEWSLLHWEPEGRLVLMSSAARRDRIFVAASGGRCAVAPDLARLGRIGWIDDEIDVAGMLYGMGRADLRSRRGGRTMLKGVHELRSAESVTITRDRVVHETADVLTPQPRWRGSFADAMVEADSLLRRIMRQRAARTAKPTLLLSGGLDSSLLAALAAQERGTGQPLGVITSVAPPDSGIPDELSFADIVASSLGLAIDPVAPPHDADTFRPPDHIIAGADGPFLSNRHCLTEAFHVAARAHGGTMLVNGCFGEMSVTGWRPPDGGLRQRLRAIARTIVRGRRPEIDQGGDGPFHMRLSLNLLAHLPKEIDDAIAAPSTLLPWSRRPGEPWGYMPGIDKTLEQTNEFYAGALRMDYPFRDLRLLRLFARFPLSFFRRDGFDRAPARHMLDGHLPDTIRLRRTGMGAAPDHVFRMQRQATHARERIATFHREGLGDWFDLDWLDRSLERVAAHGPKHVDDANQVQMTAINAEVLLWWLTRRSR